MSDATWLPVPGYEGYYEVSDQGEVRSVDRVIGILKDGRDHWRRGKVLSPARMKKGGSLRVKLSRDGHGPLVSVHALVMLAFVGPRPNGMHICHNNGDPADNRLVNLRYDTPSENALDSVDHGRCFQSRKKTCPAGHEYNEANTRFVKTPSGNMIGRQCRMCDRERQLAKRAANREAYNAAARERRKAKLQAA